MSFSKLSLTVDVSELKASLLANSDLFDEHPERRVAYGSPHNGMSDIWVRYNSPKKKGANFNDEHVAEWYPCISRIPAVIDVVASVFNFVGGETLGGVLITKLPPSGIIDKHVDSGWHAGYYDKFYVPIQNANGSLFRFENGDIDAVEGEVYQFDNSVPHWVENNSDIDRISMIVCIRTFERSIHAAA